MRNRDQMAAAGTPAHRPSQRESWTLFGVLAAVGLLMAIAVVPGVFSIDEPNYLVTVVGLREGSWSVPATQGLPPSRELAAFDPESHARSITSTPVSSLAPPLYAVLALPFSWFSWTSLFLLNIVAFVVAAWCVYTIVREQNGSVAGAVVATLLFGAGGFMIEYALGMWPHMLVVAITTAACLAALRSADRRSWGWACVAGMLAATAVGIREQSVIVVGALGASLLAFARPRLLLAAAYTAGAAILLVAISAINSERLGVFHPIPKIDAYAADVQRASAPAAEPLGGAAAVLWAKVVDMRAHPMLKDPLKGRLFLKHPETGVPIVEGAIVKKSLLQSAPWIAFAFVVLIVGWRRFGSSPAVPSMLLGTTSLIAAAVLAVIAVAGFERSDGLAFNQRYLLELVPLFAVVTGAAIGRDFSWPPFASGAVAAIASSVLLLSAVDGQSRFTIIAAAPLLIAAGGIVAGLLTGRRAARLAVPVVLGIALGWSFMIHVVDDVRGSRARRSANLATLRAIEPHVPQGSALFAFRGGRDAVGPLMLTKDALLLDVWADNGHDAPSLVDTLLRQGRRVCVRTDGFPREILVLMMDGRDTVRLRNEFPQLVEILPPS